MRTVVLVFLALLSLGVNANASAATPQFPKLTGPVVDQAEMLSAATEQELTQLILAHERATSNQVVVVTLPNLDGYAIEDYGYQLGRAWGIGQKGKDNGALLIVAKAERKIRIEVGYGLEGELTDAISSNIINAVITPDFKRAQFDQGVLDGTRAIIAALGGEYQMQQEPAGRHHVSTGWVWLMFIVFFWILPGLFGGRGRRGLFWGLLLGSTLGNDRHRGGGGFGGGGFGGGGGFSGGGGSFGGGGASGGW